MFSKTCTYAIRSSLYLAINASKKSKLSVTTLSDKLDIPKHFLAKVLQQLVRHNLTSSAKGPNGGFYLSDKNKNTRLLDIVNCFDGPDRFNSCVLGLQSCDDNNPCSFHENVKESRRSIHQLLNNETIASIAAEVLLNKNKI